IADLRRVSDLQKPLSSLLTVAKKMNLVAALATFGQRTIGEGWLSKVVGGLPDLVMFILPKICRLLEARLVYATHAAKLRQSALAASLAFDIEALEKMGAALEGLAAAITEDDKDISTTWGKIYSQIPLIGKKIG